MCGDVLSCARAESGDDSAGDLCAAVPTAIRAGGLAVRLDGISTNKIVDEGNVGRERTTRNSPDGHKESFPKYRLGADPRTPPGRSARQRPVPPPAARGPAGDTDNSVDGGTRAHAPSSARSGWHANAASGPLHPDRPARNTATGHIRAQRTVRSLSTDSGVAVAIDWSLALKKIVDHHEVDPRERQLPKGRVPERTSIPLRDALYPLPYPSASLRSRLITRLPGRHFFPASRHKPPPARRSFDWRSGRMTGRR
jgi:hypothetical protein